MKKYIIVLTLLIITFENSIGQDFGDYGPKGSANKGGKSNWMEKVYVGGGLGGLQFSQNEILVALSGMAGYRFTEKLTSGVGLTYQYYQYKPTKATFNDYGVNVFTQYTVYAPVFLMAQYEWQSLDFFEERRNYNTVLVGGGINQKVGSKGFMNFFALYNLTYKTDGDNGRYSSPWAIGMTGGIGF
jgi:hypothetical protein